MNKAIKSNHPFNLEKLEKKIGIRFKNKKILQTALTHRSWLNENRRQKAVSNERLEFLGDAILEAWATKRLFLNFPNLNEGFLTNIRAAVVRTESLAQQAKKIGLGNFLRLSKGEEKGGGRRSVSLMANTFEALVGAIYCDQNTKTAEKFLNENLLDKLMAWGKRGDAKDAKTILQEKVQAKLKLTPHYKLVNQNGPGHNRFFTSAVFFNKDKICLGKGRSKKEAEEAAAKEALTIFNKKCTIYQTKRERKEKNA